MMPRPPHQYDRVAAVLTPGQIRSARDLVRRRDPGGFELPASRVGAAPPVLERIQSGTTDRDFDLPVTPRAAKGVGDEDPWRRVTEGGDSPPQLSRRGIGIEWKEGHRLCPRDVRGIDARVGAHEA